MQGVRVKKKKILEDTFHLIQVFFPEAMATWPLYKVIKYLRWYFAITEKARHGPHYSGGELRIWARICSGLRRNWDQSCGWRDQDALIQQLEQTMWCESVRDLNQQERLKPGSTLQLGFAGGSDVKESICHAGHLDSIPGLGRFPWRRE